MFHARSNKSSGARTSHFFSPKFDAALLREIECRAVQLTLQHNPILLSMRSNSNHWLRSKCSSTSQAFTRLCSPVAACQLCPRSAAFAFAIDSGSKLVWRLLELRLYQTASRRFSFRLIFSDFLPVPSRPPISPPLCKSSSEMRSNIQDNNNQSKTSCWRVIDPKR